MSTTATQEPTGTQATPHQIPIKPTPRDGHPNTWTGTELLRTTSTYANGRCAHFCVVYTRPRYPGDLPTVDLLVARLEGDNSPQEVRDAAYTAAIGNRLLIDGTLFELRDHADRFPTLDRIDPGEHIDTATAGDATLIARSNLAQPNVTVYTLAVDDLTVTVVGTGHTDQMAYIAIASTDPLHHRGVRIDVGNRYRASDTYEL